MSLFVFLLFHIFQAHSSHFLPGFYAKQCVICYCVCLNFRAMFILGTYSFDPKSHILLIFCYSALFYSVMHLSNPLLWVYHFTVILCANRKMIMGHFQIFFCENQYCCNNFLQPLIIETDKSFFRDFFRQTWVHRGWGGGVEVRIEG